MSEPGSRDAPPAADDTEDGWTGGGSDYWRHPSGAQVAEFRDGLGCLYWSNCKIGSTAIGSVATVDEAKRLALEAALSRDADEVKRLRELIWNPHTDSFLEGVRLEAAHQRERWTAVHDAKKRPADWFWLLGYLSGKALASAIGGDTEKARHHTISSAAVLLNWHAHLTAAAEPPEPR